MFDYCYVPLRIVRVSEIDRNFLMWVSGYYHLKVWG